MAFSGTGEHLRCFQSLNGFPNIMGPDDFHTLLNPDYGGRKGSAQAMEGVGCSTKMIDPGLAGGAEKQPPGLIRQAFQMTH